MTGDDAEAKEGLLLSHDENLVCVKSLDLGTQKKLRWRTYCLGLSLVANICLSFGLLWSIRHVRIQDPQLEVYCGSPRCFFDRMHTSSFVIPAPANHVVEYEDVVWYDGIRHFSPYQMPPNDTIDDMWTDLYSHAGTTRVAGESARLLPNRTVIVPGTDNDGVVQVEVFHALHCINSLRKSLWPNRFPDYSIFQNGTRDDLITTHHMHCIDRLRMNIMCAGNIGTSTWRWQPEAEGGARWMINMEMTYKCRKYDRIWEWAAQNEILDWDDTIPSELTKQ